MLISDDGWLEAAERLPGPPQKLYTERNQSAGICVHSMEGWWQGSYAELVRPERQASWIFSNLIDGRLFQHYPVTASAWANGNARANQLYWSVESEGIAGMPLTALQRKNMHGICAAFEEWSGKEATTGDADGRGRTVWMHREVATLWTPNAGPTVCPSERYAEFFAELAAGLGREDEVTREEYEALVSRVAKLEAGQYQLGQQVFGSEAMADGRFTDAYADTTVRNLQEVVSGHLGNHPSGGAVMDGTYELRRVR